MKVGSLNRLTIPNFVREKANLEVGKDYYLVFKSENNILILPEEKGKVIGKTKLAAKGRIVIPKNILEVYKEKEFLVYYEGETAGILILNKSV